MVVTVEGSEIESSIVRPLKALASMVVRPSGRRMEVMVSRTASKAFAPITLTLAPGQ